MLGYWCRRDPALRDPTVPLGPRRVLGDADIPMHSALGATGWQAHEKRLSPVKPERLLENQQALLIRAHLKRSAIYLCHTVISSF